MNPLRPLGKFFLALPLCASVTLCQPVDTARASLSMELGQGDPYPLSKLVTGAGLSLAATALPIAAGAWWANSNGSGMPWLLILGGALAGPSMGQFYLKDPGHAWGALALRTAGAGMVMIGVLQSLDNSFSCGGGDFGGYTDEECPEHHSNAGVVPAVLGLTLFSVGLTYSFLQPWWTHPVEQTASHFRIYPTFTGMPGGRSSPGMSAQFTF